MDYLEKINQFVDALDKPAQQSLKEVTSVRKYSKGEYLLRQGEVCTHSFLLEQGIARKYYLLEGKDTTTELYFKDDIAISFQSYTMQRPSHEFIQVVEDVTVSMVHYRKFEQAKRRHTSLLELDLLMTEYYAIWLEQRLFDFHTLDATQRYQQLLEKQPHFIKHIALTHLASYLGISLETLSRIRAKF